MDFQRDVIDKSFEIPVVVDFWAPWCGPCRVLTPIIEQLADSQSELWKLVKINTEEHEDIANQYHIMSIPNVKMFYRGEVRHEFLGALPKVKIEEWLQKVLPSKGLMAFDRFLDEHPNPSVTELEALHAQYPESHEISFVLSQLLLWDNPAKSANLLTDIKMGSPFFQKAEHIRDISSFLMKEDLQDQSNQVKESLKDSNLEQAIQLIIEFLPRLLDGTNASLQISLNSDQRICIEIIPPTDEKGGNLFVN